MKEKKWEDRLNDLEARIDSLGEATAAADSAVLSLLHIVLPQLVKHRLMDLDGATKEIDALLKAKASRMHGSYGAILADFKGILLQVREDSDAGLQ